MGRLKVLKGKMSSIALPQIGLNSEQKKEACKQRNTSPIVSLFKTSHVTCSLILKSSALDVTLNCNHACFLFNHKRLLLKYNEYNGT